MILGVAILLFLLGVLAGMFLGDILEDGHDYESICTATEPPKAWQRRLFVRPKKTPEPPPQAWLDSPFAPPKDVEHDIVQMRRKKLPDPPRNPKLGQRSR